MKTAGWRVVIGCMAVGASAAFADVTVSFRDGEPIPVQAGGNGVDAYAGTRDNSLIGYPGLNNDNMGGSPIVYLGHYNNSMTIDEVHMLTDFDYGTLCAYMITNNMEIAAVALKIKFYAYRGASPYGQVLDVFKSESVLNEGSGSTGGAMGEDFGRLAVAGESCWSYKAYSTNRWANGGAHSSLDLSTHLDGGVTVSNVANQWYEFDVTDAFAVDGSDLTLHKGFVFLPRSDTHNPYSTTNTGLGQALFYSRNCTNAESRPQIVFTLVPAKSRPMSITLQDGAPVPLAAGGDGSVVYAGTRDNSVMSYVEIRNANMGGSQIIFIGDYFGAGTIDSARLLIDFDYGTLGSYLSSRNMKIDSATLSLCFYTFRGAEAKYGQTVDVFKAASVFVEGTGTNGSSYMPQDFGRPAVTGESCWSYRVYNTNYWAAGGSHSASDWSTPLAAGISITNANGCWHHFDVTDAFAGDGSDLATQEGFVIVGRNDPGSPNYTANGGYGQAEFYSSDYTGATLRPKITLHLIPKQMGTLILLK